jgi:hypothetical protein
LKQSCAHDATGDSLQVYINIQNNVQRDFSNLSRSAQSEGFLLPLHRISECGVLVSLIDAYLDALGALAFYNPADRLAGIMISVKDISAIAV